jgi:hypothetical protein
LATYSNDLPVVVGINATLQEPCGTSTGFGSLKVAGSIDAGINRAEQNAVPVNPRGSLRRVTNCGRHDK